MYVHTGAGPMTNRAYVRMYFKEDYTMTGVGVRKSIVVQMWVIPNREDSRVRIYLVLEVCLTVGQHREGPPDLGDPRVEEG